MGTTSVGLVGQVRDDGTDRWRIDWVADGVVTLVRLTGPQPSGPFVRFLAEVEGWRRVLPGEDNGRPRREAS